MRTGMKKEKIKEKNEMKNLLEAVGNFWRYDWHF
jgi:hypothetical protein